MTSANEKPPSPPASSPPAAVLAAFALVAIEADLASAMLLPSSAGFRGVRALHLLISALQLLGCGAVLAGLVALWQRASERRKLPVIVGVLGAAALAAAFALPEDFGGLAEKISEKHTATLVPVLVAAVAVIVTVVIMLLRWLTRRFTRIPAVALGLVIGAANPFVLEHDYPGIHLTLALIAGAITAVGLAGIRAPSSRRARIGMIAMGAVAAATVVVPVPNAIVSDMLRATGSVLAPFASRLHTAKARAARVPPEQRAWFAARAGMPDVPTRTPTVLPPDGVVVLITIDALRADVIMSGKHDADLPTFKALREESVRFTKARSPGAQTVPVVTGLFTGKYYSQVYWSGGTAKHAWSTEDTSVRFPEILRDGGVTTVTMPTLPEVNSMHGTVRGFMEDRPISKRPKGEPSPLAATVTERIVARLQKAANDERPLLLYAHFVDAHAPYTRGGTDCQPYDCYVREVALIDKSLAEIRKVLASEPFAKRSVLIVSADHGEAFGEHGQRFHATTLYEELLRVPLLVNGPMFQPRAVDVPVTLLDLGPTILELFGHAAPAAFMGESLVRLLRGEPDKLTRPIAADSGRLIQAYIFDDNLKIIRNNRNHTAELYDLAKDPGETQNIFDVTPDAQDRLALVSAFFEANAFRKKGYSPPYRK
ncbi:Choline-sulfatase [Minicystis rosea]|nr:Choline-sulfatase [Minicystis rosea]